MLLNLFFKLSFICCLFALTTKSSTPCGAQVMPDTLPYFKLLGKNGIKDITCRQLERKPERALLITTSRNLRRNLTLSPANLLEEDHYDEKVASTTWLILEPYIQEGHMVLVVVDSLLLDIHIIRRMSTLSIRPLQLVDTETKRDKNSRRDSRIGETGSSLVLMINKGRADVFDAVRFFPMSGALRVPQIKVLILGDKSGMRSNLLHPMFRNIINISYLCLEKGNASDDGNDPTSLGFMTLYSRCLFCDNGELQMQILASWSLGAKVLPKFDPFPYQLENLHGHRIKSVGIPYFPYVDFDMGSISPNKTTVFQDSLNKRILDAVSPHLNFTYDVELPPDMKIGYPTANGSWTGLVGVLQRSDADVTMLLTTSAEKILFMDHATYCPSDPLVLLSKRPQLKSQYLTVVKPFTLDVWICLLVSILLWALSLWFHEKWRSGLSGGKSMTFSGSIFYSWAIILEDPPSSTPTYTSGKMLVGWWLIASLVVATAFRSSLVANLTVQSKTRPIDSFEDLHDNNNLEVGIYNILLTGSSLAYFKNSQPEIFQRVKPMTMEEGLTKALKGSYAFVVSKVHITTKTASYADSYGQSPFYISKQAYPVAPDYGWAFRKGAPFFPLFKKTFNRLIESGLIDYWLQDVIGRRIRETRIDSKEKPKNESVMMNRNVDSEDNKITLKTRQLIGVYLVMALGHVIAFCFFLGEILFHGFDSTGGKLAISIG